MIKPRYREGLCPSKGPKWEKAMATHSSTLAWKIPRMEEPGRLQSMGSLRVGHDWATSLSLFTCMHWRRQWQPIPVLLPGESQGRGACVGCGLWGHTELDTTEVTYSRSSIVSLAHSVAIICSICHLWDFVGKGGICCMKRKHSLDGKQNYSYVGSLAVQLVDYPV